MTSHSSFSDVAALLVTSAALGALFVRLRQPLLIAYTVVGVLMGPAGAGVVQGNSTIEAFARLGVTVLLFIVGLKLDMQHVRHIGRVALATGLGQLAFTIAIGFGITLLLGRGWLEALYIAVALTFSSTIIIVKLLSDKREIDSLHGRIAVGFLVVQDLAVIVAMMVMSAFRADGGGSAAAVLASLAARVAGVAFVTWLTMRWVLPWLLPRMARSQELLLLFAIAWGVALSSGAAWAGFSMEAGAFLAGFSLASTPFRDVVSSRLTARRDFLLVFFFVELGAGLELSALGAELLPAAALALFVLIGNPLIVMAIMGFMGYRKRTGFLAGLTVAQISEFSIIFVAMGVSMGHVGRSALALTTLVGVATIAVSTYLITYSHPLYERVGRFLPRFERARPFRELEVDAGAPPHERLQAIVVGLGRYGSRVLTRLLESGVRVMGIDFDPEVVRDLQREGRPARFGDAEDADFLESLDLREVGWVISTLPRAQASLEVLRAFRTAGFRGSAVLAARDPVPSEALEAADVQRVLRPFVDAADHAADALAGDIRATGA